MEKMIGAGLEIFNQPTEQINIDTLANWEHRMQVTLHSVFSQIDTAKLELQNKTTTSLSSSSLSYKAAAPDGTGFSFNFPIPYNPGSKVDYVFVSPFETELTRSKEQGTVHSELIKLSDLNFTAEAEALPVTLINSLEVKNGDGVHTEFTAAFINAVKPDEALNDDTVKLAASAFNEAVDTK